MAWFAVNKDGTEVCFYNKPVNCTFAKCNMDFPMHNREYEVRADWQSSELIRARYRYVNADGKFVFKTSDGIIYEFSEDTSYKKTQDYWAEEYLEDEYLTPLQGCKLPHGTINYILGRTLTWEDEPIEIV